jgi:hypothetical protein
MAYTPKNIHKGTTSSGESFTIREWKFEEIATLETLKYLWFLVLILTVFSVAAPILTLLAIYSFSGRLQILQILAVLSGVYFIIDCHMGWIALGALKLFFEERTITTLLMANGASVLVSGTLMLFSPLFFHMIKKPLRQYNDASYEALPRLAKNKLRREIETRRINFLYLLIVAFILGLFVTDAIIDPQKGWTKHGLLGIPALSSDY